MAKTAAPTAYETALHLLAEQARAAIGGKVTVRLIGGAADVVGTLVEVAEPGETVLTIEAFEGPGDVRDRWWRTWTVPLGHIAAFATGPAQRKA